MPRVLCLTSTYPRWAGDATPAFVHNLARSLGNHGWQVDIIAPGFAGAADREQLDGIAVQRYRYAWPATAQTLCYDGGALGKLARSPRNALKLPSLLLALARATDRQLVRHHYDLVHSHWVLPQGLIGALVAHRHRIPHVITVHGGDAFGLTGALPTRLKRLAFTRSSAVTVNSSATEAVIRPLVTDGTNLVRIPMGVAVSQTISAAAQAQRRQQLGIAADAPLVGFAGRLVPEKGPLDLLMAMQTLRKRLPRLRGVIVGEGPMREELEAYVRDAGLDDCVHFCGWLNGDDYVETMATFDVFVAPSKRAANGWIEAQGLTVIEAMMAERPVVATRCGGIVDSVEDGASGLLCPMGDSAAIATAIGTLLNDSAQRVRMGCAGRERALARFSEAASASAFAELFEACCRADSRAKP